MFTSKKKIKRLAPISFLLASLMFLQAAVPLSALAEANSWCWVWVKGHLDDSNSSGTWVEGHFERLQMSYKDWVALNFTVDPIDTSNGNNQFSEKRLQVSTPGIPLVFDLQYSSLPGNRPDGNLGTNWTHSYVWHVDVNTNTAPEQATLYAGTEGPITFVPISSNGLFSSVARSWSMQVETNGYSVHLPSGMDYIFNETGRLDRIQDVWGNQVACSYDTNECLQAVTHSNGRSLVFSNQWNSAAGKWRITFAAVDDGASLSFAYGADGQFTQVVEQVDANSYTSTYRYADGILTNRINGAGFNYVYKYEEEYGELNGKGTHLSVNGYYDHDVDYVSDNETDLTYHERGLDQVYRYSRNDDNQLVAQYGPAATGSAAESLGSCYIYSSNGTDRIEETLFDESTGASWSTWSLYDDAHNVTNVAVSYCSTNPVQQYAMEYDAEWQLPVSRTEPDGSRTETVYTNGLPLITKAFYSATESHDTHYAYFTNGLLRAVANANGHVTQYTYDSNGYQATTVPELGPIASNTCSSLGYVMQTDLLGQDGSSSGRTTVYERDAKGRAKRIDYADGNYATFAYNALGYLTNQVDRAGRVTVKTYAPTKQLTSVTRYLNQNGSNVPVRIGYDLDEQMNTLRISEPRGRYVESYQMDLQDRVTAVTNIEGQVMNLSYTVGDFVDQRERFDGSTINYAYDSAGQKTNETYRTADGALTVSIDTDYWPDGQIKRVDDASSFVEYEYDLLNRLTSTTTSVTSASSVVNHQYDAVGNVTNTVVSVGTNSIPYSRSYDSAERLKSITADDSEQFVYAYSPINGQIESISNTVSGITCSYQYDIMDRATNMTYRTSDGSLIRALGYTYDAAGMIRQKKIVDDASSFVKHAYTYDSLDRLVAEQRTADGSSAQLIGYSYDLAGNRLSKTEDNLKTTYALGVGNRLASSSTASVTNSLFVSGSSSELIGTDDRWGELYVSNVTASASIVPSVSGNGFYATVPALSGQTNTVVAAIRDAAGNMDYVSKDYWVDTGGSQASATATYDYNAEGCLTNLNGTSLQWDERYRLKEVQIANGTNLAKSVSYEYDVLGRRVSRIEDSVTNFFVYDGQQIVADLDGNGDILRSYVWGPGIDNLLSMTVYTNGGSQASATYYAIKDHQNTVLAMVDEAGAIVESYEYDAFGNTTILDASGIECSESSIGNRYMFQGREYDSATGLYYFRARWYDSDSGRWLSKDPIGISGGLNLYAAFENNPVNMVDPSGLDNFMGGQNDPPPGVDSSGNVVGGGQLDGMLTAGAEASAIGLGVVGGALALDAGAGYLAAGTGVTITMDGATLAAGTPKGVVIVTATALLYDNLKDFFDSLFNKPNQGGPCIEGK